MQFPTQKHKIKKPNNGVFDDIGIPVNKKRVQQLIFGVLVGIALSSLLSILLLPNKQDMERGLFFLL